MKNILNTELKRLVDLLSQIQDTTNFNAYLEKIKTPDTLSYTELKYYLEQIQEIISSYNDSCYWSEELSAVSKCLSLQNQIEYVKNKTNFEFSSRFVLFLFGADKGTCSAMAREFAPSLSRRGSKRWVSTV